MGDRWQSEDTLPSQRHSTRVPHENTSEEGYVLRLGVLVSPASAKRSHNAAQDKCYKYVVVQCSGVAALGAMIIVDYIALRIRLAIILAIRLPVCICLQQNFIEH